MKRAHGRCRHCGRTERAHSDLENRTERGFPQRPHASLSSRNEDQKNASNTKFLTLPPYPPFPRSLRAHARSRSRLPGENVFEPSEINLAAPDHGSATATPIPHDRTSWRSLRRADGRLREHAYALQQRPSRYVADEHLGRLGGPVVREALLRPEDSLRRGASSGSGSPANCRS